MNKQVYEPGVCKYMKMCKHYSGNSYTCNVGADKMYCGVYRQFEGFKNGN